MATEEVTFSVMLLDQIASIFGEHSRLELMSAERKARWRREMDWLLSVTDHIVEFVPSRQTYRAYNSKFVASQGSLDDFEDQTMFSYVSRDADESKKGNTRRDDDKWWLPMVRVPLGGLSESSRRWIQLRKDSATQVHKAAMAINAQVLMEMEVPETYVESLPKDGLVNGAQDSRPEKQNRGLGCDMEEENAGQRKQALVGFDSQFGEEGADVGLSIQESYSRILESLAFMLISRIDDVLYADSIARGPTTKCLKGRQFPPNVAAKTGHAKMPLEVKAGKKFSYTEHVGVARSPTARH
ncbi:hypothetical protein ZIOFF_054849 [Zingiber officinale]|uniref:PRONE domain-containing protein n=1 Tax=Zingiber officinale TaxID=94328 RepID=A0A8J5FE54_ZINOF|nr:hypothetical protein ZIOFF_054849 [Zingiber officinale]